MHFWWLDKHTLSALAVGLLTATSGGGNNSININSDSDQNPRTNNGNGDCDVGPQKTSAQQQQQQQKDKNCAKESWTGNLNAIPQPTMVTWLVDGNNLSCSRRVPNDRDTILRELRTIASPTSAHSSWSLSSPFESGGEEDNDDDETAVSKTKSKPSKKRKYKSPQISVTTNVFVVFDGNEDEHSERIIATETDLWFRCAVTDGRHRRKDRADDYIVDCAIPHLHKLIEERFRNKQGTTKVHLVSADKELQKRVLATRVMNGGSIVHPPKFWKDYLPVLRKQQQEQRQRQRQQQEDEEAETN
uniref:NYN domain-containing protein n=1 Tax=Pseudo-nitzschia australis TaxID=44445 RepID=A0A7S4EQ88_9STRA|mmetsp:Transcript_11215/g.23680  ORF Transcript_11215/g.23680 Transcript_11215/m.23680 type:complete len:302 (-) Transcript_11215:678-1583(-)